MERLVIRGPGGSVLCDWGAAALLRDNVMHWLEERRPTGRFPAIHALADAPAYPSRPLPEADDVADELAIALPMLADKTGRELAVGIWTRAVMKRERRLPALRGTVLAAEIDWALPLEVPTGTTLEALYRPFLLALRRVGSRRHRMSA